MWLILTSIVVSLVTIYHLWSKHKFDYWSKRGIKGPRSAFLLPFGHFGSVMLTQKTLMQTIKPYYDQFPNEPFVGLYLGRKPILMMKDPKYIEQILIKNFNIFANKRLDASIKNEGLFMADGDYWRTMRQHLGPVFSTGKLKKMVPCILKCCEDYLNFIEGHIENNSDQEMRSLTLRYTVAVTGTCLLGIDTEPFTEESNKYIEMGEHFFKLKANTVAQVALSAVLPHIKYILQKYFRLKGHKDDFFDYCVDLLKKLLKLRENNRHTKNDFIDVLRGFKHQGHIERTFENRVHRVEINDELLGNHLLSFFTGFEATGGNVSMIFQELALHPEIQEKAYNVIKDITEKHNGVLTYEALQEMTYLQMIFDETLRKHNSILFRVASQDFTFSGTNISIEKGTHVLLPPVLLHLDPNYFENPHVFDPERFSPENRMKIPACVFAPFGEGPRHCIAKRFVTLQALALLATFLTRFKLDATEKTVKHLKMDPGTLSLRSLSGLWVKISKRT